ncbi:MAG: family 16 glycosylhydrolase [Candidatus Pseudobacter hemicellulosilyticus]|uniref:Family 16 glycosylhydrolase n=1 Tax=Candidatus Pseudobacter hemicellulosilyticus TaxID=3121375 RepID=A0AAJ6BH04_9BACT|nr:MAG: family 16 glycosylhydrolase [Pseudobacter sp.]
MKYPLPKLFLPASFFILLLASAGCGKSGGGEQVTPKLSMSDLSVAEGNGGANIIEVVLTLDRASSQTVTVAASTIEGTAKAGEDYNPLNKLPVSFRPGETQVVIPVSIVGDDIREADETFQLRLENPVNAVMLKGTVTITLGNDDTRVPFSNTGYEAPTSYPGYTLAWSDEFTGSALDASNWVAETGDGCPNLCGWGNNELQYYMQPSSNLFLQDGKMIIEARAESYGGKNYSSSRIKTQGKRSFTFGRIDIRAILPYGKGIWPAVWMMPQNSVYGNWPTSGELDIMEHVGHELSRVHGTVHYGPGPQSISVSRSYDLPAGKFNDGFHVFSIEWEKDEIRWYVDNTLFSTFNKAAAGTNTYPFNEAFYLIVNLAVGGNWPGAPDAETSFPKWLILDYIRVYQR